MQPEMPVRTRNLVYWRGQDRVADAVLETPAGLTQEVSAPMCSKSIPTPTEETTENGIPYGFCQCGCGKKTNIVPQGRHKGTPRKYFPSHHSRPLFIPDSYTVTESGALLVPLHSKKHPGLFAVVDPEDAELVSPYRWYPCKGTGETFYAISGNCMGRPCRKQQMHRLIMGITDPSIYVDHRDHDGLHNCKENLRIATAQQNQRNRKSLGGVSSYKGVWLKRKSNTWYAEVTGKDYRRRMGPFPTEELAAHAYDEAARELHGDFAYLNFPDELEVAS